MKSKTHINGGHGGRVYRPWTAIICERLLDYLGQQMRETEIESQRARNWPGGMLGPLQGEMHLKK